MSSPQFAQPADNTFGFQGPANSGAVQVEPAVWYQELHFLDHQAGFVHIVRVRFTPQEGLVVSTPTIVSVAQHSTEQLGNRPNVLMQIVRSRALY